MATITVTTFDSDGTVLDEHTIEIPDDPGALPTPDVTALAATLDDARAQLDAAQAALDTLAAQG